jgi:hypothetical protein
VVYSRHEDRLEDREIVSPDIGCLFSLPGKSPQRENMLSALILAGLVKLNLAIEKPIIPAIVFAVIAFVLGLLVELPFLAVAIAAPINFGLSFLYFWLLKRTEGQGFFAISRSGALTINHFQRSFLHQVPG